VASANAGPKYYRRYLCNDPPENLGKLLQYAKIYVLESLINVDSNNIRVEMKRNDFNSEI